MRFDTRTANVGILIVCVLTTLGVYRFVSDQRTFGAREDFAAITAYHRDALQNRMNSCRSALAGLAGLFSGSQTVERDDLRRFMSEMAIRNYLPGILGLGYIEQVAREDLDAFIAEAAAHGQPNLQVHPDTGADPLFIVKYIEPQDENSDAIGLDLNFDETRSKTAVIARDTGTPLLTPSLQLVQDGIGKPGFLLLMPLYWPDLETNTQDQRRAAFRGWVYMPFIGENFLSGLTSLEHHEFEFRVFESSVVAPEHLIYDSAPEGFDREAARFREVELIEAFGRTWTIEWSSSQNYEATQTDHFDLIILLAGLVLTSLIGFLLWTISRREQVITQQVIEKTHALKTREEENRAIIENAVVGFVTIDGDHRVIRCNEIACKIMSKSRTEVSGAKIVDVVPELETVPEADEIQNVPVENGARILGVGKSHWKTAEGADRTTFILRDITALERAHEQVAETERRWDLALRGAEIGVFDINLETGKSAVSASWRRLMQIDDGIPNESLQEHFMSRVHPDDLPALLASDQACIKGETDRSLSLYRLKPPEGSWRWMRSDAAVVDRDVKGRAMRLVGAQTDVTEELLAQASLRSSEERFRLIFSSAPIGNAVIDVNGHFTMVNEALCQMVGYKKDEMEGGRNFVHLISREDSERIIPEVARLKASGAHSFETECQIIRKDGSRFWGMVDVGWTHDDQIDEDIYIMQIGDITEKKHVEKIKSEFVATVSHELRTPLTAIRGALGLLEASTADYIAPPAKRLLDMAQSNAERLIGLVSDILDMEQIESGRMTFNFSEEMVSEVMKDAESQMLCYADNLGVTLQFDPPEEDCTIWTDTARIAQVFDNLISNACKFSESKGTVYVKGEVRGEDVLFSVRNRGRGVPDSFRTKIFQPFSQVDSTDTREKGGTGLGLSICKRMINHMGGEIGYDSELGEETVFWFTMPRYLRDSQNDNGALASTAANG
ncbi:MAG: CHASE domain-containing protein [Heliomarina sp.]|uniref:CHASE domain-containing protein n=1 Tax=Heliomarina sp. TaxID=2917556 RepID=UPI0040586150